MKYCLYFSRKFLNFKKVLCLKIFIVVYLTTKKSLKMIGRIKFSAHYIPFYFGCNGGKTPTPVINPIVGPVLPGPIVSNPRPVLPAPIQGGGRTFTPIVGGGGAGINRLLQIQQER